MVKFSDIKAEISETSALMWSDRQFDAMWCPGRWSINLAFKQRVKIFIPVRESGILSSR